MIVILNKDIKGTGKAGDVVKVSDGYARNMLIPKGWATEATEGNVRSLEKQKAIAAEKKAEEKAAAQAHAEKIKAIIKADINKVAENANIIRESDSKDLEIMATTLCSTIYLEHEDYVEAFYFISGDSRPYVWSLTNGLQQVVSDRENADGGMNDCIVADGDFSIVCKYLK